QGTVIEVRNGRTAECEYFTITINAFYWRYGIGVLNLNHADLVAIVQTEKEFIVKAHRIVVEGNTCSVQSVKPGCKIKRCFAQTSGRHTHVGGTCLNAIEIQLHV